MTTYRERTGQVMPRILVIIDEFQNLFSRSDRLAQEAESLLNDLIRQGRAFDSTSSWGRSHCG